MSVVPKPGVDRLVETYRTYAHALAAEVIRKYPSVDRDDVRGSAELGLVEAANHFDPARGVLFKTFAYYRIRGAIYDSLRKLGWFAKDAARLKFERAANEYMQDYSEGAPPNGSPAESLQELQDLTASVVNSYILSLSVIGDQLPETGAQSAEERCIDDQTKERIQQALSKLPAKNRQVLEEYYFRDQTLESIGARLGLSKSWVSRLHAKSLDMIRGALEEAGITGAASG